jgi:hypothetical protein
VENNVSYFKAMKSAIQKTIKGIRVSSPKACPAVGAVIGAARRAGIPISPEFIKNLTSSFDKMNK